MQAQGGSRALDVDFEEIRAEHQRVLEALARLEAAVGGRTGATAEIDLTALSGALDSFLEFHDTEIVAHMRAEEEHLYPLLSRYLPPEVGSAEAMLREHDTARALVALLRHARSRLKRAVPDLEPEVASLVEDLSALLREHIRKEDAVFNPLLRRLLAKSSRSAGARDPL